MKKSLVIFLLIIGSILSISFYLSHFLFGIFLSICVFWIYNFYKENMVDVQVDENQLNENEKGI